jgi:hypothetical protein
LLKNQAVTHVPEHLLPMSQIYTPTGEGRFLSTEGLPAGVQHDR